MGIDGRNGCFADLVAVPIRNLHNVPDVVSDEEAVFVEPLAAAHQVLVQCPVDARMAVSVVGPGRLGLLMAQVLAHTGCKLTVIGRNPKKLLLCEKKGIQAIHVEGLVARQDRDVVVECTGAPEGLDIAMQLVRPRGTIVLKSTCAEPGQLNLAPAVINEVNVLGSRCGPFPEAINALARQAVDVRSLISRTFPIEQALEAFEAARAPDNVKVLLKVNPR
jgi:threonine dehydrogenase-like Zn-dependent dehydrogenase